MFNCMDLSSIHDRFVVWTGHTDIEGGNMIVSGDISPGYINTRNQFQMIEHLGATFLRNHRVYKDKVLYFGPMGCRTGFYLLLVGDYESADIVPLLQEMFLFIRDFEGDVPGAAARDHDPRKCCGSGCGEGDEKRKEREQKREE